MVVFHEKWKIATSIESNATLDAHDAYIGVQNSMTEGGSHGWRDREIRTKQKEALV